MTRIRGHYHEMTWDQLSSSAELLKKKIQFRSARCEHGFTPRETCNDCEGGYVQDTSVYANLPDNLIAVAVSDDGETVGFIR